MHTASYATGNKREKKTITAKRKIHCVSSRILNRISALHKIRFLEVVYCFNLFVGGSDTRRPKIPPKLDIIKLIFHVLQIPAFTIPCFTDSGFYNSMFYRFRLLQFRVLQIPAFTIPIETTNHQQKCAGILL